MQVPLRMSVDQISFSAHADYAQTEGFIKALQPAHVVRLCLVSQSMTRVPAPAEVILASPGVRQVPFVCLLADYGQRGCSGAHSLLSRGCLPLVLSGA